MLYAQVLRVIKKELTPSTVMEDLDMRPIGRKTVNTPNLDLFKEEYIKTLRTYGEDQETEEQYPLNFEDLKAVLKGEVQFDETRPINFADYKTTLKKAKLEAPNRLLMKLVVKSTPDLLEGKKLKETLGKIEFVDEGKYLDIEKKKDSDQTTDRHKAELVDISVKKALEGHYVCGTCGAGFVLFDNCALHSIICGVEKLVVQCDWCDFSSNQYNLYLYRFQRHMEKHHQELEAFVQEGNKLPRHPDAPEDEEEEAKTEDKEEPKKDEEEKKKKTSKEDNEESKASKEDEEDMEKKIEDELLKGDSEAVDAAETEEKILGEEEAAQGDTSFEETGDEATPLKRKADSGEEEEEKPKAQRKSTRRSKRQKMK